MADPGFSRGGGREPSRGGVNTPNIPENCMKSKEFGRPGGGRASLTPPLDPPMVWCRSTVLVHWPQAIHSDFQGVALRSGLKVTSLPDGSIENPI